MGGIDFWTGKGLSGWPHLLASLRVLFITTIGTRVMRRSHGSNIPRLLGEHLTEGTVLRFFTAIIVACELWEPRYAVRKVWIWREDNSVETLRDGRLSGVAIDGEYRPRGHLGDPTPETSERRIYIGMKQSGLEIS